MKLWSLKLSTQVFQLRRETWKIQDFNGVWARDLAIPVRRSNQLSYEATDVGSWSFVGSNVSVGNESTMKWYIWNGSYMNCGYEIMCVAPVSRSHGFKPRWSPEFFRLLYAIAKLAFITARIIASLDILALYYEKNKNKNSLKRGLELEKWQVFQKCQKLWFSVP